MSDPSEVCRVRALLCEDRISAAPDEATRQEWQDLAREWHFLAHSLGGRREPIAESDIVMSESEIAIY